MALARTRLAALSLACLTLVAACAGDSSTGPTSSATLSQALDELSLGTVRGGGISTFGLMPPVPTVVPSSCVYDGATQSFACPTVTTSSFTFRRTFTLLDAANVPQSQFGPTTAAVRMRSSVAGSVATPAGSPTIDESDDLTLTGLLTGTHALDGTMTLSFTGAFGPSATPVVSHVTIALAHLVLPTDPKGFPTGVMTMDETSTTGGVAAPPVHVRMELDGTSRVKITATSGSVTTTCVLDLLNPSPSCFP